MCVNIRLCKSLMNSLKVEERQYKCYLRSIKFDARFFDRNVDHNDSYLLKYFWTPMSQFGAFYIESKHNVIGKGRNVVFVKTRHLPSYDLHFSLWDSPRHTNTFFCGKKLVHKLMIKHHTFHWFDAPASWRFGTVRTGTPFLQIIS